MHARVHLALATWFLAVNLAPAGPLEEAQKNVEEGRYAEAEEALKPLLAQTKPPREAIRLSLEAALADGRLVTAERRVKALLAETADDPELVLLAADVADRAGNDLLEGDRLYYYVQLQQAKTDALANAYYRLLTRTEKPDALRRYIAAYGADEIAWEEGLRMLRRQIDGRRVGAISETVVLLLNGFPEANRVAEMDGLLSEAFQVFGVQVHAIVQTLMTHALPQDFFRGRAWSELERSERRVGLSDLLAGQAAAGRLWPIEVQGRLSWVKDIRDEAQRLERARQILGIEQSYLRAENPEYYRDYVWAILDAYHAYQAPGKELVDEAKAKELCENLLDKYQGREAEIRFLCDRFANDRPNNKYYWSDDTRTEMVLAHPAAFSAQRLRDSAKSIESKQQLQQVLKAAGETRWDVRGALAARQAQLDEVEGAIEGMRAYLRVHAGDIDRTAVINFLSVAAIPLEKRKQILQEYATAIGKHRTVTELVKDIEHRYRDARPVVEGLKYPAAGQDPISVALVTLSGSSRPEDRFDAAVAAALKAFGSRFPNPSKGVDNDAMARLIEMYQGKDYSRYAGQKLGFARTLAPNLSDQADFNAYAKTVEGDHAATWELLRGALDAKANPDWNLFAEARHPSQSDQALLAGHYRDMTANACLRHLEVNASAWPDATLYEQALAVYKLHDMSGASEERQTKVLQWLGLLPDSDNRAIPKLPDDLLSALTDTYLVKREGARPHEYGTLLALQAAGRLKEGVAAQVAGMKNLPPRKQVQELAWFMSERPHETRCGLDKAAGFGEVVRDDYLPAVAAAAAQVSEIEAPLTIVDYGFPARYQGWLYGQGTPEETRSKVYALERPILLLAVRGARIADDVGGGWDAFRRGLRDAIESDNQGMARAYGTAMARATHQGDGVELDEVEELTAYFVRTRQWEYLYPLVRTVKCSNDAAQSCINQLRTQAAMQVPGLYAVNPKDPAYPIYVAGDELAAGNDQRAWELVRPKLDVFAKAPLAYDPNLAVWIVERMRLARGEDDVLLQKARDLVDLLLSEEEKLGPTLTAQAMLTRAEILRNQRNYDAAKMEYQTLRSNPELASTEAGMEANLRNVDLLITMGDTASVTPILENWLATQDPRLKTEAHYFQARLAFDAEDYREVRKELDKVFEYNFTHTEGRLLEGRWRKATRRVDDTEILVGRVGEREIIIPGQTLPIEIQDRNLSVVGGGRSIPVVVTTSSGGDKEVVNLYSQPRNPYRFRGSIDTKLAGAVAGNGYLEINGADEIHYEVDPEFLTKRGLPQGAVKSLRVVDDARLAVSAGTFLTEKEEQEKAIQRQIEELRGESSGRTSVGSLRPGNPIYILVRDRDRNLGDNFDTVTLQARTSSGDVVGEVVISETAEHSGIFRGELATQLPPPRATASDSAEGADPGAVINSQREGVWRSRSDGKEGKFLGVDTMGSHAVKRVELDTEEKDQITRLELWGRLNEDFVRVGSYPPADTVQLGGVWHREATRPDNVKTLADAQRFFLETYEGEPQRLQAAALSKIDRDRIGHIRGAIYIPEYRQVEFGLLGSESNGLAAYLLVDGQPLVGGETSHIADRSRAAALPAGGHYVDIYYWSWDAPREVQLAIRGQDGKLAPVSPDAFSIAKHPELKDFLKDRAEIEKTDTGFAATFEDPMRLRAVRWDFVQFTGSNVSASRLAMVNEKDEEVIPSPTDFTSALTNDTLEVAPGDRVTLQYIDRITVAGSRKDLTGSLSAAFQNGVIGFYYEDVVDTGRGMVSQLYEAFRFRPGDQFVVSLKDSDVDQTPEADQVMIHVTSTSGSSATLKAVETGQKGVTEDGAVTGIHTGVFTAFLKTVDRAEKDDQGKTLPLPADTIIVKPGDTITASFVDMENASPGIPIERMASIVVADKTASDLTLYHTWQAVEEREVTNRETGEKVIVPTTVGYYRPFTSEELASAEPIRVSGANPLTVLVVNHSRALHAASTMDAAVITDSELKTAREQKRQPKWIRIKLKLGGGTPTGFVLPGAQGGRDEEGVETIEERILHPGNFTGSVLFQLGEPNSAEAEEAAKKGIVTCQGNEVVALQTFDEQGQVEFEKRIQLATAGHVALLDSRFEEPRQTIHLGQEFYIQVVDPDQDISPEQDQVSVTVTSAGGGDSQTIPLSETLNHSGVFTAVLRPTFAGEGDAAPAASGGADGGEEADSETDDAEADVADAAEPDRELDEEHESSAGPPPSGLHVPSIEVLLGDQLTFTYADTFTPVAIDPGDRITIGMIHKGDDGRVEAFSKRYPDAETAVRTQFRMAEALFEMAKAYRNINEPEKATEAIREGRRALEEVLRDYPDNPLIAEGEFLLANLYEELGREALDQLAAQKKKDAQAELSDEERAQRQAEEKATIERAHANLANALDRFSAVIARWPESVFAARSQFHKGVCLELMGNFKDANEEYVKMTYTYPDSPLVADATIRLGLFFYQVENRYDVSGHIFYNFATRYPTHEKSNRVLFMAAQSYMKGSETLAASAPVDPRKKDPDAKEREEKIIDGYAKAADALAKLVEERRESVDKDLRAQAMYWAGECYYRIGDYRNAYLNLKRCTFEYPDTDWARRCRGFLLQQAQAFENL